MSIELKHLRYAETAERHGSFRKAADALSLKQSNLSRRIRHLEELLGVRLFERITIGFYTSLSAGNLRATLVEHARRFPQVEIGPVEGSRARLLGEIENGTIDVAIVTGEPAPGYGRSMMLWSERIIVALPEDHPLAVNEIIYWTDLRRERFLLSKRDPGPEIEDILVAKDDEAAAKCGITPLDYLLFPSCSPGGAYSAAKAAFRTGGPAGGCAYHRRAATVGLVTRRAPPAVVARM